MVSPTCTAQLHSSSDAALRWSAPMRGAQAPKRSAPNHVTEGRAPHLQAPATTFQTTTKTAINTTALSTHQCRPSTLHPISKCQREERERKRENSKGEHERIHWNQPTMCGCFWSKTSTRTGPISDPGFRSGWTCIWVSIRSIGSAHTI